MLQYIIIITGCIIQCCEQAGGVLYKIKVKGRPVTAACNGRVGVRSVNTAQLYESARGVMFPMDSSCWLVIPNT